MSHTFCTHSLYHIKRVIYSIKRAIYSTKKDLYSMRMWVYSQYSQYSQSKPLPRNRIARHFAHIYSLHIKRAIYSIERAIYSNKRDCEHTYSQYLQSSQSSQSKPLPRNRTPGLLYVKSEYGVATNSRLLKNYRSRLQNIICFIGLFCKRDL